MNSSAVFDNGFVATATGGGCTALVKRIRGHEIIVTSIDEPSIPGMNEDAHVTISCGAHSIGFSLPAGTLNHFLASITDT